ncbi:MAG: amino acid adenylation domain-containing protein [Hamadaea sp.]|uniref:non-ribosomal peptide synthetase n=1 Tax=Hamadaea sp. TaxID=2024425 RepID=UPI00182B792C|nr:non-ribosomal peptide synthetase [Hamadaea sp.]NUR70877.1 amino acid adenylation domain-containing protein [Hamadaea sp.]NUT20868.1 amino acid adenylation domain-containing protein [Hamadaea sp.]
MTELSPLKQQLLAQLLKSGGGAAPAPVDVIPPWTGDFPVRLSFAQEAVWLIAQLAGDVPLFNLIAAEWIPDGLPLARIQQDLNDIAARHDSMRMAVLSGGDRPCMTVLPSLSVVLEEITVEGDDLDAVRTAALRFAARPYQLDEAPLWRSAVLVTPSGRRMFMLGAHHIVMDASSLVLVCSELAGALPRTPLPLRFADFAAWQRERVAGGAFSRDLDYWRGRLADLPAPLDMPADHPRTAERSLAGATVQRELSAEVIDQVRALSRAEGVTTYMTMLAAYAVLLRRYTGEDDLLIGSTVSGRNRPELQRMVGMLVNMVPVRADLTGSLTFRELLKQVRDRVSEALVHQNVPFDLLIREVRPGYPRNRAPLAQVGFNMPMEENRQMLTSVALPMTPQGSQLDMTLHVVPLAGGGLDVELEYSTALFREETAYALLDQFMALVGALAADPAADVKRVPVGEELTTAPAQPDVPLLPALFRAQALRTPDATALVDKGETMTYAELERAVEVLAAHLAAEGVGPETRVGVYLDRGAAAVCALLAVGRLGACYVTLDPQHPGARTRLIVEEAGLRTVVTTTENVNRLAALGITAFCVDTVSDDGRRAPIPALRPDLAAYMMYTSGSTGRPKGVVITYGGIANRALWPIRSLGLGPADRVLQKTALTFDAAGWEIFSPLASGGTVVVAPPGVERDPEAMVRAVADEAVTVLQVVPSVLRQLVSAPGWEECSALRLLFSAGEPLTGELCARVRELVDVTIYNTYGPTECSIDVTEYAWPPEQQDGPVPIGRPLDGMRAVVLDREGNPVPPGGIGELYAGGIGVARGYHARPELTAERFVPDPFGPAGSRLYRTGDLVRRRPGGVLEFLGRRDDQVKVNGVRIEPAEIERALIDPPTVTAAAVVVRTLPDGGRQLIAYLAGEGRSEATELRARLRQTLPDALIPSVFVHLDALPQTSSGKIDRVALLQRDLPATAPAERIEPRDETERGVADEWIALLGCESVGVYDDFFALGGQSLQLGLLANRLRKRFGRDIALSRLYSATTVETQAALLRVPAVDQPAPEHRVARVPRGGPLPLSAGQERMWIAEALRPGSPEQMVPAIFPLDADATLASVTAAVRRLTGNHEILRTRYLLVGDEPRQVIDPQARLEIDEVRRDDEDLAGDIAHLAGRPFDLAAGPVLRGRLVVTASGRKSLVVLAHHIAWDGVSAQAFAEELRAPADAPDVQYADYAAWQSAWLAENTERELAYWREQLTGARATEIPCDHPRPKVWQGRGESLAFRIPAAVGAPIVQIGREAGATPFMTFLAAFSCLLAGVAGTDDVVVGTPVAGRSSPEVDRLIGYFANILVLRTTVGADDTFLDVLACTRESARTAYAHQDLPYDRLVDGLRVKRDRSRNPLFQIMFEVGAERPSYLPGLPADGDLSHVRIPWPTAMYDLTVTLTAEPDGSYLGIAEFATDLYRRATITRLIGEYQDLLREIVADERQTVRVLTPATLPEVLRCRARVTPDAIAVQQDDQRLTYAELDDRADRMATQLRGLGIRPEIPVAVCLPRSPELVVAALAAMRSGGVFVPLDPASPAHRLASMLDSIKPGVVVAHSEIAEHLPPDGPAVLVPGDASPAAAPGAGPPAAVPGQLAYVVHTSGSTGEPKGVMVAHGAFLAHCASVATRYGMTAADRLLLTSPPFVDVVCEHLGVTIVAGATLVLGPARPWSPAELADYVETHGVTFLDLPPTAWRDFLDHAEPGDRRLQTLRVVNIGTDVVRATDVHRWHALGLAGEFLACYGPTEAVVTASLLEVSANLGNQLAPESVVPIGTEVGGRIGYVLDENLRAVPTGTPGELYLGGALLARGYAGRPALTAERFLPDPYADVPGSRMYRSGDLVSRDSDGVLHFHGRADRQVKVNGFRVELAEVEAAVLTHPGVRAAVVVAVESHGTPELAAYIVAGDSTAPTAHDVRAHLRGRLPAYMVPRHVVTLTELPLTPNGKVDSRRLPAVAVDGPETPAGDVGLDDAPVPETEDLIRGIWRDVLGEPEIDDDADFFELGGNSLMVTRVHTRLQDLFGVTVSLGEMFDATTVRSQTAMITDAVIAEVGQLSDDDVAALLREGGDDLAGDLGRAVEHTSGENDERQ